MAHHSENAFGYLLALQSCVVPAQLVLEMDLCIIGRSEGCNIMISDSLKLVSRLHAKIERIGQRYVLSDLGSANGTFVNGQRIAQPHTLIQDDVLGFGKPQNVIRFLDPDPTNIPVLLLSYDAQRMVFRINHHDVDLTAAQLRLLQHLYNHSGELCTRESCAQVLWERDYDRVHDSGALDQAIAGVRARLRQIQPNVEFIHTRRGLGFVLFPGGHIESNAH